MEPQINQLNLPWKPFQFITEPHPRPSLIPFFIPNFGILKMLRIVIVNFRPQLKIFAYVLK